MKIQHLRNGVILISAGLVFLFNNLGYVDWEVWETIISWWPVYLIALGIEIVFRNSLLKPIALISPLTFAFFILGPAWWQWEGKQHERFVQESQWSQPISAQTSLLQADLEFKLGNLKVNETGDKVINCHFKYEGLEPYKDYAEQNGVAKLTLEDRGKKYIGLRFDEAGLTHSNWRVKDRDWEVAFDTSTPLELVLCSQVAKNDLDFSQLKVKKLDLTFQVSKANIKLGDKVDTVIMNLEENVSKVYLAVPKEAVIVLEKKVGLGSISCSNVNLIKAGQSESYKSGHPVIFLTYQGGLCKLDVRGY